MNLGQTKSNADKVLTKRQVAALLYGAYMMKSDPTHPNPWAFDALLLMYLLGLRVGEVVLLRYSHIGQRDTRGAIRSVMVPTEKKIRDGKRLDPLDALHPVPVLAHHSWLAKSFDPRARSGKAALSPWLFPGKWADRPISDRMIDYAFREASARAGLPRVYSTHCLRHTSATEIARAMSRCGAGESEVEAWTGNFLRHSGTMYRHGNKVTRTYMHFAPRGIAEWAPLAASGVLALPTPLGPVGPSRFDPALRFGRR